MPLPPIRHILHAAVIRAMGHEDLSIPAYDEEPNPAVVVISVTMIFVCIALIMYDITIDLSIIHIRITAA